MANAFSIASQIGAALSPAFYSGLGVISSNAASSKSFARQKELMEHQAALNYHYAQLSSKNAPTWNRQGLESAGYNPMLAVQNATSGANSSWTSPNTTNMDDYAGNITAQATNATSFMNARSTAEQTASNIATNLTQQSLNKAQSKKTLSETTAQDIKNGYLDKREQQEIGNISANTDKLQADTAYTNELKDNIKAELELRQYIGELQASSGIQQAGISANATKYASNQHYRGVLDTNITNKSIADSHMPSGRSFSFRNYTGGVKDIMSGIGSILHGNQEYYNDTATETYHDKKFGTTKTYKSSRSGRRRKH